LLISDTRNNRRIVSAKIQYTISCNVIRNVEVPSNPDSQNER
jgi:hypothetical protein